MEIQVQELIDKIKRDGLETASQEAAKIRSAAEAEAGRIIESAKKEAEEVIYKARQNAERSEKAGIAALEQASRNLVLAFREEIQGLLNKLVEDRINAVYGVDVLKNALPELIKNWAAKGENNLSVILPESALSGIEAYFRDELNGELLEGVELKPNRKIDAGFHISNKEGSIYYDFSVESVAGLFSSYLNPKLAEILKASSAKPKIKACD